MNSSPQIRSEFSFPWDVDHQPKSGLVQRLELFYKFCHLQWQIAQKGSEAARPTLNRIRQALDQTVIATVLIVLPKVYSGWDSIRPVLLSTRALLPIAPRITPEEEAVEQDAAWELLAEFQALEPDRQDHVARNLALLWGHFEDGFGGLSEFLRSPQMEQSAYLEKLQAASSRMRLARGSEVAFHYVTVELMRQYVSCLQSGRSDRAAISLATCAAALINRGRMLTPAIPAP
jgi:hypothetical protein